MIRTVKEEATGTQKRLVIYLSILAVVGFLFFFFLKDVKHSTAATIFIATMIGPLLFWRFRVAIGFLGFVALLLSRTVTLSEAIGLMDLEIILFLIGMMVVVGQLRDSGVIRWFVAKVLSLCRNDVRFFIVLILTLSSVLAALVDELASMLLITALLLDFCDFFGINPMKYVISAILATNVGSAWLAQGNPIGIHIALSNGIPLGTFAMKALPVGILSLASIVAITLFWLRKDLDSLNKNVRFRAEGSLADYMSDWSRVKNRGLFITGAIIFFVVVTALALDYWLELWFGFEMGTLLAAVPLASAGLIKLWQRRHALVYLERDVDWRTLLFHMLLFAMTGALTYVGFTSRIASLMLDITKEYGKAGAIAAMVAIPGVLSAGLDNIVVATQLTPVVQGLTQQLGSTVLPWALLFGSCFGGNMTMVGSSANIFALGETEKRAGYYVNIDYWWKIGLAGALVPMAIGISFLLIFG